MSHFTTIQTHIKDIEALKSACAELDLTLEEKGEARGYGNNRHPGDYIIRLHLENATVYALNINPVSTKPR